MNSLNIKDIDINTRERKVIDIKFHISAGDLKKHASYQTLHFQKFGIKDEKEIHTFKVLIFWLDGYELLPTFKIQ